jgi:hypothetical protein
MDVIGDTCMAIQSYSSQGDTENKGKLYLETYGVLQALVVRQNAVIDLCQAFNSSRAKGDFPALERVRAARVAVAGYPTKKQRDGRGPHFLVQMSLRRNSFQTVSLSGEPKFAHVNVSELIQQQEGELGQMLEGVVADLKEADAQHKAQFRGQTLESIFPHTLSYAFEKMMNTYGAAGGLV